VDPAKEAEEIVVLDFKNCRVWDQSGLEAIDNIALKFKNAGKEVNPPPWSMNPPPLSMNPPLCPWKVGPERSRGHR
jgi:hypothetical protein